MAELGLIAQAGSILDTVLSCVEDRKLLAARELVEQRAAICMGCEKLREKRGVYSCVTCGCSFKKKIAVHGSSCPLGKW